VVEGRDEALGVERSRAAGAGRGDRLSVGVVDQVAAGEDAGLVGLGGGVCHQDVSLGVEVDLPAQQLRAWVVADGDEEAGDRQRSGLAGHGVAQRQRLEPVAAVDLGDLGVPEDLELLVGERALLHDLGGPELVAAVDQVDLGAEPREEGGLLDGGVTPADHGDRLLAEEEAVAGRTPGDTTPRELFLARQSELPVARPRREDHRPRGVGVGGRPDDLQVAGEVDLDHVVGHQLGAEPLGLGAHLVHQRRAHDAVAEAREVLDLRGGHQRAAGGDRTLEHQRLERGPCGVERRGVARRPRADDDDVAGLVRHAAPRSWVAPGTRDRTDRRRAEFPGARRRDRQRNGRVAERTALSSPHRNRSATWVSPTGARTTSHPPVRP
jgi:hypothetical protein